MRFSKDGTQLQLTAVDGRRALVVLPNDPELVDILAKNGVDISGGCCPFRRLLQWVLLVLVLPVRLHLSGLLARCVF